MKTEHIDYDDYNICQVAFHLACIAFAKNRNYDDDLPVLFPMRTREDVTNIRDFIEIYEIIDGKNILVGYISVDNEGFGTNVYESYHMPDGDMIKYKKILRQLLQEVVADAEHGARAAMKALRSKAYLRAQRQAQRKQRQAQRN